MAWEAPSPGREPTACDTATLAELGPGHRRAERSKRLAGWFLVWLPSLGARRAWTGTGWLTVAWLASLTLLITVSGSWPGIAFTLTRAIERDRAYRLVAVGPYDSAAKSGVFAIWRQA